MINLLKKIRRLLLGRIRALFLKIQLPSIKIGSNFFCGPYCRVSSGRSITIGDNFYMGHNCHLGANIHIFNNVMIASQVAIVGGDHKIDNVDGPIRFSGRDELKLTTFKDDCWIGHGAIILHGVTIGEGSVVAAGSVVTKDVLPNTIVAGNPAKFIRNRKLIAEED